MIEINDIFGNIISIEENKPNDTYQDWFEDKSVRGEVFGWTSHTDIRTGEIFLIPVDKDGIEFISCDGEYRHQNEVINWNDD